jgi:hypothetical protein
VLRASPSKNWTDIQRNEVAGKEFGCLRLIAGEDAYLGGTAAERLAACHGLGKAL